MMQAKNLKRLHNLEFVTSSRAYKPPPFEIQTATEAQADGDGMTVSLSELMNSSYHEEEDEFLGFESLLAPPAPQARQQPPSPSPSASVVTKLSDAISAASAVASQLYAGLVYPPRVDPSKGGSQMTSLVQPMLLSLLPKGSSSDPSTSSGARCPSDWFVCDNPRDHLRVFVLQGSDSLDHW
jgi:hypothetical protein